MDARIVVVGAGPVGCLLAILLSKRGFRVAVLEKRSDWRNKSTHYSGRSINLALSARGFKALKMAGLEEKILDLSVPMYKRAIHDEKGNVFNQNYDSFGNSIKSISRESINSFLLNEAIQQGVDVHFDADIEIFKNEKALHYVLNGNENHLEYDYLFGCDGANSQVRSFVNNEFGCEPDVEPLNYGYKELTLLKNEGWDEHSLHIWPRKKFMLIALPNLDQTYTGTLFMPLDGDDSFENASKDVLAFFKMHFPDSLPFINDLIEQYHHSPVSKLKTVLNPVWHLKEYDICLMGDSAHAIVPFYGQGLNAGFEDVSTFIETLDFHDRNLNLFDFSTFEKRRKEDTDAIASLALQNFVEMRDNVADDVFRKKKKLENHLQGLFPSIWIPQYSLVTFSPNVSYVDAQKIGVYQSTYLDKIYSTFGDDLRPVEDYQELMVEYQRELSLL